jgi:hypothetical protein
MFTTLLNKTGTIYTKTSTQNDIGEEVLSLTAGGSYPCRLDVISKPVVVDGVYQTSIDNYVVFLDKNVPITRYDIIQIDGTDYEVIGVQTFDNSAIAHHKEVYVKYHDHA